MRRSTLVLALAAPVACAAQDVIVRGGDGPGAQLLRAATAAPHALRAGSTPLEFPRDTTITSTLIVIGRPTYLAGTVRGDVIVVGSDLFLRPGVNVSGRAVAIGGTVATTSLGTVRGGTESYRDERYSVGTAPAGGVTLDYQPPRAHAGQSAVELAGIQGFLVPGYDRVDGLSLPVGLTFQASDRLAEFTPRLTYRSRLGIIDPGADVTLMPDGLFRVELAGGWETQTHDAWNYSDLVNSTLTFFDGLDTRNYYRSAGVEGRGIVRTESKGYALESYFGGRYQEVHPITAVGNVWAVHGKTSPERILRSNPLVEDGRIGSGLVGAELVDTAGVVVSRVSGEVEQSFAAPTGTTNFTQVTLDAHVGFPTFGTQRLAFRGHAVLSRGDSVPRSRYAYLGGSGTLPVLELLELGGDELLFVETRYLVPVNAIMLPMIGAPVLTFRHIMGSAGIKSLPSLEQEIGLGIGLSAVRLDVTTDVARTRGTKLGLGISLR